jgi:hypothetical protein
LVPGPRLAPASRSLGRAVPGGHATARAIMGGPARGRAAGPHRRAPGSGDRCRLAGHASPGGASSSRSPSGGDHRHGYGTCARRARRAPRFRGDPMARYQGCRCRPGAVPRPRTPLDGRCRRPRASDRLLTSYRPDPGEGRCQVGARLSRKSGRACCSRLHVPPPDEYRTGRSPRGAGPRGPVPTAR